MSSGNREPWGAPRGGIFLGTVMAAPPNFYTAEAEKLMDEVAMKGVRGGNSAISHNGRHCIDLLSSSQCQCIHLQDWRHPSYQVADGSAYALQRRTAPRTPFHPFPCQLHGYPPLIPLSSRTDLLDRTYLGSPNR